MSQAALLIQPEVRLSEQIMNAMLPKEFRRDPLQCAFVSQRFRATLREPIRVLQPEKRLNC